MLGSQTTDQREQFLASARAAREARAFEKERQNAVVKIQVKYVNSNNLLDFLFVFLYLFFLSLMFRLRIDFLTFVFYPQML